MVNLLLLILNLHIRANSKSRGSLTNTQNYNCIHGRPKEVIYN